MRASEREEKSRQRVVAVSLVYGKKNSKGRGKSFLFSPPSLLTRRSHFFRDRSFKNSSPTECLGHGEKTIQRDWFHQNRWRGERCIRSPFDPLCRPRSHAPSLRTARAHKHSPATSIEISNGLTIEFVPWELEPSHRKLAEAAFDKKNTKAAKKKKSDEEEKEGRATLLRCRVYEARLERGTTTLWHSHDRDTAYIVCGDDAPKSGDGGEEGEEPEAVLGNETVADGAASLRDLPLATGQAFCFLAGGRPFVHRLTFPGDSKRARAHIVGVEVSEGEDVEEEAGGEEEEEEGDRGREGAGRAGAEGVVEGATTSTSPSSFSSYSPLPPCYGLVQKSKLFDFYKLKLPARGGTTGEHRFPPGGATAAVAVAARPRGEERPLSVVSSSFSDSNASAWRSLASHGGAFAVFEGESIEDLELRNDAEVEFEAAVVVIL